MADGSSARRRTVALGAALGLVGAVLWAEPAAACKCMVRPVDEALERGYAVAVVSNPSTSRHPETYRVEAGRPAGLPERVARHEDHPCGGPEPFPGGAQAMLLERKGELWQSVGCGFVDFGQAAQYVLGTPHAVPGGPAVAVAAGPFGGSRLAALDRDGRVVAWDGQTGRAEHVVACPGGAAVAALGFDGRRYHDMGPASVSVHDAQTLDVRRSVRVPLRKSEIIVAMRCADPAGDGVEVLLRDHSRDDQVRSVVVTGRQVRTRDLGPRGVLAAGPDGFVAGSSKGLVRLGVDGSRTKITGPGFGPTYDGLAVSRDGRTIAVHGYVTKKRRVIRTVDARTGATLGEWAAADGVSGMAFTGSGDLLVRSGAPSESTLRRFDRAMRPLAQGPGGPGWGFAAVGESGVGYRDARLNAASVGGDLLVADELRLAGTEHVAALSAAGFADERPAGAAEREPALTVESGDDGGAPAGVGLLGGGGAAAALAAVVLLLVRRRRPNV